jgi:sterol desaturase/sphingolipid hydroxylase (fatty acid hydroxylase superfamily)
VTGPAELPPAISASREWLLAAFFALLFLESAWRVWRGQQPVALRLVAVNVAMWLVELALRSASFGLRVAAFDWVASVSPWRIPVGIGAACVAYVLVDGLYYGRHRLLHETRWGWALHSVHHTSTELSLVAAIRLGWVQRVLDDFFYLPLAFLGFDPEMLLWVVLANEVFPGWCHIGAIGLLGPLDGVINTPANHRFHHAEARALANSNYASTFMFWDRLFGTWRSGPPPTRFGIEGARVGLNPLWIQFGGVASWLARPRRAPGDPEQRQPSHERDEEGRPHPGASRREREESETCRRPEDEGDPGSRPDVGAGAGDDPDAPVGTALRVREGA